MGGLVSKNNHVMTDVANPQPDPSPLKLCSTFLFFSSVLPSSRSKESKLTTSKKEIVSAPRRNWGIGLLLLLPYEQHLLFQQDLGSMPTWFKVAASSAPLKEVKLK